MPASDMLASRAIFVLCIFGFLKEFRPSESFITQYLVGPHKNFTKEQVIQNIYPVGTYSTLCLSMVVFLVTDALNYKPIVVVEGLAGIATFSLLIWGSSLSAIQTAEVFYGLFIASDVAYSTYIYAFCEKERYQKVTSYTRMALQFGRFISGLMSQLAVSLQVLDYHELQYLSLAGVSLATFFGFWLPSSDTSVYFHRSLPIDDPEACPSSSAVQGSESKGGYPLFTHSLENPTESSEDCTERSSSKPNDQLTISRRKPKNNSIIHQGFLVIWNEFCCAYSDSYVLKWSFWWAVSCCGYLQITAYVQNLWQETVDEFGGTLYNGAASAVYTVLGILATWALGQTRLNVAKFSHWLIFLCALVAGILTFISAFTTSLLLQYAVYGTFKVLYQVMITLTNSEVAQALTQDSRGLVFGFNTFVALILQTVLTMCVAAKGGFELATRSQFIVYGTFFIIVGVGFGVTITIETLLKCLQKDIVQKDMAVIDVE